MVGGYSGEGYFSRLIGIWLKPLKVLETYKDEQGIADPLIFFTYSTALSSVLTFLFYVIQGGGFTTALSAFGSGLLVSVIFVFGFSSLFHVLVKLLGGPNPYYQTFKAFAYMSAFGILGALIMGLSAYAPLLRIANIILSLWVLLLVGSSLKHYTDLTGGRLMAIWAVVFILISIFVILVRPQLVLLF